MPLFEDGQSSEPPRVVSGDSQECQQQGLMWRPVHVDQTPSHTTSTVSVASQPTSAVPPAQISTVEAPKVWDDIVESAVAGLLGISHLDGSASQPKPEPQKRSLPTPLSTQQASYPPPAAAAAAASRTSLLEVNGTRRNPVPSYAALTAGRTMEPPPTVRLVPSKPKRATTPVSMLAQLPMKPKASRCKNGPRNFFKQPKSVSDVARQTDALLKRGRGRPKKSETAKKNQTQRPSIVNLGKQSVSGRQIKKPKPYAMEVFGKNGRPPEFTDSDDNEGWNASISKPLASAHVGSVDDGPVWKPVPKTLKALSVTQDGDSKVAASRDAGTDPQSPNSVPQVSPEANGSKSSKLEKSLGAQFDTKNQNVVKKASSRNGTAKNSASLDQSGEAVTGSDDESVGNLDVLHFAPNSIAPPVEVVAETVTGRVVKKPTSFASEIFGKNGRKPMLDDHQQNSDPTKRRANDPAIRKPGFHRRGSDSSGHTGETDRKPTAVKRGRPVKHLPPQPDEKRGPGRPPKRGPGRPRKSPVHDLPKKRGPGRPKKLPLDGIQVKRGPGRPRKHPLPEGGEAKKPASASKATEDTSKNQHMFVKASSSRRSFPGVDGKRKSAGGGPRETVEDMFKSIVQATVKSTVPGESTPATRKAAERDTAAASSKGTRSRRVSLGSPKTRPKETVEDMFKAIVQATRAAEKVVDDSSGAESPSKTTRGRSKESTPESKSDFVRNDAVTSKTVEKPATTESDAKADSNRSEGEQVMVPPKRKRGRPRKSETSSGKTPPEVVTVVEKGRSPIEVTKEAETKTQPDSLEGKIDGEIVVKRKRGRPKKSAVEARQKLAEKAKGNVATKRKRTVEDEFKEIVQVTREVEKSESHENEIDDGSPKRKRGRPKKSDTIATKKMAHNGLARQERKETVEDMFKSIVQATMDSTLPKDENAEQAEGKKEDVPAIAKGNRGRPRKTDAQKSSGHRRQRTPSPVLGLKPKEQAALPWKRSSKQPKLFTNEIFGKNGRPPVPEDNGNGLALSKKSSSSTLVQYRGLSNRAARSSDKNESRSKNGKKHDDAKLKSNGEKSKTAPRPNALTTSVHESPVQVGSRLEIFWEGDSQYFGGVVQKVGGDLKVYVVYDDGDKEWIDLASQKYRLITSEGASSSPVAITGSHDASSPKKLGAMVKKARRGRKRNAAPISEDEQGSGKNSDDPEDNMYGLTVGCRVAVYWEGDRKYFNGKVTQKRFNQRKNFYVEYDDGDHEWIDFDDHKFRVFVDDGDDGASDGEDGSLSDEDDEEKKALHELREECSRGVITNISVGSRVAVFWDGDNEYFKARVTKSREGHKKSFRLKYDDGQDEWIDLRRHKFVQLPDRRPRGRPRIYPRINRDE